MRSTPTKDLSDVSVTENGRLRGTDYEPGLVHDDDGDEMCAVSPPESILVARQLREKDQNKGLNRRVVHPKEL